MRALSDKLQSSEKEIFLFSLAVNLDVGEFKKISNKRIPHKCIRTISPNALQNVLKIPFTPSSHRLEWLSSGDRGKTGDWQIFIQTIHNSSICSVDKSSTWEFEEKNRNKSYIGIPSRFSDSLSAIGWALICAQHFPVPPTPHWSEIWNALLPLIQPNPD